MIKIPPQTSTSIEANKTFSYWNWIAKPRRAAKPSWMVFYHSHHDEKRVLKNHLVEFEGNAIHSFSKSTIEEGGEAMLRRV